MSECPYCTNAFEVNDTCHDEFRMWQGLVGPYYIPTIEDGVLTWTNTGGLPNPNPINIIGAQGNGLYIGGIAETTGDLPETAENGVTWLVGADEPYEGYVYLNGSWVDIGAVTPGPTGPQGIPGAGVPSGGTTGQVLQKASNTDYQTEWADPASGGDPPGTMLPLMDGTAAVGTARSYAREDHVHPQDSEIAELKTSITQKGLEIHVGANQQFTTLLGAVEYAESYPNSTVYVDEGTYDIVSELTAKYPNFFTSYTTSQKHGYGLEVGFNTKYVFSQNAKVLASLSDNEAEYNAHFSAFMVMNSDVEIVGLNLTCVNTQYCIHDDPVIKTARCLHIFDNCFLSLNNSSNSRSGKAVIGGGFTAQTTAIYKHCHFVSAGASFDNAVVSYHNSPLSYGKSVLTLVNNYFYQGTACITGYGTSPDRSTLLAVGNAFVDGAVPFISTADASNVEIYEGNNVVSEPFSASGIGYGRIISNGFAIINFLVSSSTTIPAYSQATVGTLASKFRPKNPVSDIPCVGREGSTPIALTVRIATDGTVKVYNTSSQQHTCSEIVGNLLYYLY